MKRAASISKRRPWSEEELRELASAYPHRCTEELAAELNRTVCAVYGQATKLGVAKTPAFLAEFCRLKKGQQKAGINSRYPKGHVPANAGLRRPGWHAGRMKETQFKKGERAGVAAANWVPVGTVRPDPEGYLRIKLREAHAGEPYGFGNTKVWPMYNRYVWEQANGPIPAQHIVAFKDGDRCNCAIDNLQLMSRADNARRNSMWRLPRELAEVIHLAGVLKRKIRSRNGEEQTERPSGPSV